MAAKLWAWCKQFQRLIEAWLCRENLTGWEAAQIPDLRKIVPFCVFTISSFIRNRCPGRASGLAYTSLLALVPVLAVAFSIGTSLIGRDALRQHQVIKLMVERVAPLDLAKVEQISEDIAGYVREIRIGAVGVFAALALIIVGISLLSSVESALNDIWGQSRGRSWLARTVHYWALLTLGPLVIALVLSLTAGSTFSSASQSIAGVPILGGLVFTGSPLLVMVIALFLFYRLMPNAQVEWSAAFFGAVVGGVLWHLNSIFNAYYLKHVLAGNQFYAQLALLPVFLMGIYFAWLIVLFGAQAAYAFQNRVIYTQEQLADAVSQQNREFIGLRIMVFVGRAFAKGSPPPTLVNIGEGLGIPTRLAGRILCKLEAAGLVRQITGGSPAYVPAQPLDNITGCEILEALRVGKGQEQPTRDDADLPYVRAEFARINEAERHAAAKLSLAKMVQAKE